MFRKFWILLLCRVCLICMLCPVAISKEESTIGYPNDFVYKVPKSIKDPSSFVINSNFRTQYGKERSYLQINIITKFQKTRVYD